MRRVFSAFPICGRDRARLAFPCGDSRRKGALLVAAMLLFYRATTQAKLHAEAKISEADARATALATVPGGAVSSSELEKEHGKLIWSFDIAQVGSKNITEVQVDARTGKIVSSKTETPDKERQEAIAEKKGDMTY